MSVRLLRGDCRELLAAMPAASVHAVVTDPPYELTSARPGGRSEATRGAVMGGFMGMRWDGTGVAFDVETWRQALRVLKPGGYLLAFGGTRTYHRLACAIEDAGFEIRDQIGWAFGSGFPKSHNGAWGGTALKPAWEPICMARRPLIGTVDANWREHGTGALNIDGCRVGTDGGCAGAGAGAGARVFGNGLNGTFAQPVPGLGRWPANLIHDGSEEVLAAFPDAPGAMAPVTGHEPTGHGFSGNVYGRAGAKGRQPSDRRDGGGSAARFFYCAKAGREERNEGLEGLEGLVTDDGRKTPADNAYQRGKTLRQNHHPTVKPTDLMRYLCRLVTPKGGTVLDPFAGSGSTLKAAELEGFDTIGIELSAEYCEIARRRIAADAPLFADVEAPPAQAE